MDYLQDFLDVKALEGCSTRTIEFYKFNLNKFFSSIEISPTEVTTQQIRKFLADYKKERNVSNVTLDNMRRVYSSFFHWLHQEGYVLKDPSAAVNRIKADKIIKTPFREEELEILRDNCKDIRESAIIELLYSSGMRIGELAGLSKEDIDWKNSCAIVLGKGAKEREVYFNTKSKMTLKKYLDTRKDDNPSLFVSLKAPHNRLQIPAYEKILRQLGQRCDIHCHPHRFRRTCATTLLNKGMPIQEVSKILGHTKLETTLLYCEIDQKQIAANHKKYMS